MKTTAPPQVILYAYLRLSRESDGSASIDTQRAARIAWMDSGEFTRWLAELGVTRDQVEVREFVDSGVSGSKPLEMRKDMKRLMQDVERPTDGPNVKRMLIAWKLDRYARSVSEFLRLIAWGEAHGVRVATTDNTINTTTATGRMVATVLAALAEWEREMIRGRIADGHATRRTQGRWGSGRPPFGYQIERRDDAAYLAIDDAQAEIVRAAVQKLITDGTVAGTARMTGLSEPQWRRLLKAPTLRGMRAHNGALILAEDGVTPIQFADPIISAAEAKAVRERLLKLATGTDRAPRSETPMCAEQSRCYKCAGRLNGGKSDKGVPLYRCKKGHVTIYAETLDGAVTEEFLARFGGFAEYVVRLEGGNDLSAEMIEAQEQAERLGQRMATAGPLMLTSLESLAEQLEASYAALRAAHDPDVREVLEPTGRTLGATWEAQPAERPRLLADVGLQVTLHPKQREERLEITWAVGGDDQAVAELLSEMEHSG